MKLQRQFNRRVKGKEYSKWLVVLPPEVVEQLGWEEGDDLEPAVSGEDLRFRKARKGSRGGS